MHKNDSAQVQELRNHVTHPLQTVIVVGAGSAGYLTALTFRLTLPGIRVVVINSPNIPVIGVGESTTTAVPRFLHDMLGLDRQRFYAAVRPTWKLGIRFEWGDPRDSHFNYTFDPCVELQVSPLGKLNSFHCLTDMADASMFSALMDRNLAPCVLRPDGQHVVADGVGYHIENKAFIAYLEQLVLEHGAEIVRADVTKVVRQPDGGVASLTMNDGRELTADLYVDCTGFRSLLLGKTLGERYVSYADSLFCDTAVVGSWPRGPDDVFRPYTTAETMDHGWCWRIEFEDHITRGYVHSSQFCTPEEAWLEARRKNPKLPEDLRVIKFPSGRYENFWVHNVIGIGNASGFVEPLEATALHLIIEQLRLVRLALADNGLSVNAAMQQVQNRRFRELWDDVRAFLAVHYKFNRRSDTPFWQHCRATTNLGCAEPLAEFFQAAGPTVICDSLIPPKSIFGYGGYLSLLLGQRVPTAFQFTPTSAEQEEWNNYRANVRQRTSRALTMPAAMQLVHSPNWRW